MGMLSRIAQSVGEFGERYAEHKLKDISEQELLDKKDAIDRQREARILEAQAKITEVANVRQDGIRAQDHTWKSEADANNEALALAREGRNNKHAETMADAGYGHSERMQQAGFDNNAPVQAAQIAASGANTAQSQAGTARANEDLKTLQSKNEMLDKFTSEADPQIRAKIATDIAVMSGKDPEVFKQTSIDTGSTAKDGTPIYRNVLMDMSNPSQPKLVEAQPQWNAQHKKPLGDSDVEALATEKTVKELGVRNSTSMFVPNDGVDNTRQYDAALEANKVKIRNSGMLNQSSDNNKPIKDVLREGIIQGESHGNPTATNIPKAGEKATSAGGYGQITDDTAIDYGAKRSADGTISFEEKNKAWEKFYNTNYERFDGNLLKVAAAQFAPNNVVTAQKEADKNGTDWRKALKISDENRDYVNKTFMPNVRKIARKNGMTITPEMLEVL